MPMFLGGKRNAAPAPVVVHLKHDDDDDLLPPWEQQAGSPSTPLRMQLEQAQHDAQAIKLSSLNLMERMKSLREKKNVLAEHRRSLSNERILHLDNEYGIPTISSSCENTAASSPSSDKASSPENTPPPRRRFFLRKSSSSNINSNNSLGEEKKHVRFDQELILKTTATTSSDEGDFVTTTTTTRAALPPVSPPSSDDEEEDDDSNYLNTISPFQQYKNRRNNKNKKKNSNNNNKKKNKKRLALPKVWTIAFFRKSLGLAPESSEKTTNTTEKDGLAVSSSRSNDDSPAITVDNAVAWKLQQQPVADKNNDNEELTAACSQLSSKRLPPVGQHQLQLYSQGTPQGNSVTILLEELLAAGIRRAEYDAWFLDTQRGEHLGSEFLNQVNPNGSVPALLDYGHDHNQQPQHQGNNLLDFLPWTQTQQSSHGPKTSQPSPIRVFESGSILMYLTQERFPNSPFCPPTTSPKQRAEVQNWLCWQMSSTPTIGTESGFGRFFFLQHHLQQQGNGAAMEANMALLHHYTIETKRQLQVLNQRLEDNVYVAGKDYTIADMAIFAWYGQLVLGRLYGRAACDFLNVQKDYPDVLRWAQDVARRPAVQRGLIVNRVTPATKNHLDENSSSVKASSSSTTTFNRHNVAIPSPGAPEWASLQIQPGVQKGVRRIPPPQPCVRDRHAASDIDKALEAFTEGSSCF